MSCLFCFLLACFLTGGYRDSMMVNKRLACRYRRTWYGHTALHATGMTFLFLFRPAPYSICPGCCTHFLLRPVRHNPGCRPADGTNPWLPVHYRCAHTNRRSVRGYADGNNCWQHKPRFIAQRSEISLAKALAQLMLSKSTMLCTTLPGWSISIA